MDNNTHNQISSITHTPPPACTPRPGVIDRVSPPSKLSSDFDFMDIYDLKMIKLYMINDILCKLA